MADARNFIEGMITIVIRTEGKLDIKTVKVNDEIDAEGLQNIIVNALHNHHICCEWEGSELASH